jgi:hypothetical protein
VSKIKSPHVTPRTANTAERIDLTHTHNTMLITLLTRRVGTNLLLKKDAKPRTQPTNTPRKASAEAEVVAVLTQTKVNTTCKEMARYPHQNQE